MKLGLRAGLVWGAVVAIAASACAADPGDSAKGNASDAVTSSSGGGGTSSGSSGTAPGDDGSTGTTPTPDDASEAATVASDDASTDDASVDVPVDAPVNSDAPPPTGCASGATVIAMTALGNVNFGTAGAVCITFMGNVNGWNASNVQGRTVTVVGSTTQSPAISGDNLGNQPGIMPGADGYVYWNYTAGQVSYASMATF
jgi:hypothetical protein